MPRLRVAVATRPLAAGHRYHAGGLLPALGVSSRTARPWSTWTPTATSTRVGCASSPPPCSPSTARHPGPAGAAWTPYRAHPALCDRLAAVIAARADRNYLVAAMAAVPLSSATSLPIRPPGFRSGPHSVRGRRGTGQVPGAAARTPAVPDPGPADRAGLRPRRRGRRPTWLAFAAALGYPVDGGPGPAARRTAADYLLQAIPDDSGPVTRLFHQALADELLARRHQPSDERTLVAALRPAPGATWATASGYALAYAADHASSARQPARPAR